MMQKPQGLWRRLWKTSKILPKVCIDYSNAPIDVRLDLACMFARFIPSYERLVISYGTSSFIITNVRRNGEPVNYAMCRTSDTKEPFDCNTKDIIFIRYKMDKVLIGELK